jgi:hypothetical protein
MGFGCDETLTQVGQSLGDDLRVDNFLGDWGRCAAKGGKGSQIAAIAGVFEGFLGVSRVKEKGHQRRGD